MGYLTIKLQNSTWYKCLNLSLTGSQMYICTCVHTFVQKEVHKYARTHIPMYARMENPKTICPRHHLMRGHKNIKVYPLTLTGSVSVLTLVLLNVDIKCLCKQCRSRSVGFRRSQLIWICTVCHSVCEFISTWIKLSDWLKNWKWAWHLNLFSMTRVKSCTFL